MKKLFCTLMLALSPLLALAQANLEINTPAINGIKQAMAGRHTQLAPHYGSGAVGITRDGSIRMRCLCRSGPR